MSAERVKQYLLEHGIQHETDQHDLAYTTSEVAEAADLPGHQMAKAVMLKADDRLVMAVVPGDKKVDLEKAAAVLETTDVGLADEKEFAPLFPDCEPGAEPPFGALYGVPALVDTGLDSPRITFNAGTHTETLTIALDDYLELTNPKRTDLSL
ncbi:MAG TPA: YbaK/EbsC family protein [Acidimicrobiia bacterium]|nr:YbaK/EbsC family protein [Acidimicrobiia bacterium]